MDAGRLNGGWRFWRWPVTVAAALAVIGAAVPLLVPASYFLPHITRLASEKLGQPVSIADLRVHLFPTPRAIAKGLEVGMKGDVRVEELEIVPDLLSLVSGPKSLRLVRAEGVRMSERAFAMLAALPKGEAGAEPVLVRRVQLRKVELRNPALKLPPLDLELRLGDALALEEARLETRDIDVRVVVAEEAAAFDGRFYGGTIRGTVRLDTTRQWQVAGKASLAGVELLPIQAALGKPAQFSGRLKADATFSARARKPDQLADALALDAPFEISGGTYQGYDLSKVGGLSTKLDKGGSTRFDELRGKLQVRGRNVKVTELCARSPSLAAGGHVQIAPDQQLSGKLDVSMNRTGGFVGIPVQLKGTTSDPWFMPSKGYLIGAAVGTVVLPGIGTSIGASIGSRTEGTSNCK
jgi:uncharacterized protein involved in outer membrane biogenesis